MKTIPVNFIGYGDWGSRLAQKVQDEGFIIQNLVTDREDIGVQYENLLKRNTIENIDWTLPTFISTGPLYHHDLLKLSKERVFVEKPFYIFEKNNSSIPYSPYVNYHWYNSLKLRTVKNFIGYDWKNLKIELFTTTKIDRGFSIFNDFLPHVLSILKFLNSNYIEKYSINKVSDTVYEIKFNFGEQNIIFIVGVTDKRYALFETENITIKTDKPKTLIVNNIQINIDKDSLSESVHRYYNYYLNGTCDRIFYSDEFHTFILELGGKDLT